MIILGIVLWLILGGLSAGALIRQVTERKALQAAVEGLKSRYDALDVGLNRVATILEGRAREKSDDVLALGHILAIAVPSSDVLDVSEHWEPAENWHIPFTRHQLGYMKFAYLPIWYTQESDESWGEHDDFERPLSRYSPRLMAQA